MKFEQISESVESIAIIIASCTAILGINAWKREHVGRRRLDLAEKSLALFYEAKEVINATRSSFGQSGDAQLIEQWASEGGAAQGEPAQPPLLALRLSRRQRKLFRQIRVLRFRFEAVFGREAAQPFNDLFAVRRDICDAEYEFLLMQGNGAACEQNETRTTELLAIMYGGRDTHDPTTIRLNALVEEIDKACRPVIESYGRTLTATLLLRARQGLSILESQPWVARLRSVWRGSPHV